MHEKPWSLVSAVVLFLLRVSAAHAQADAPAVPSPLSPWVDWALHDAPAYGCAFVGDEALCDWPGRLELSLRADGGAFSQRLQLDRPGRVILPGGSGRWPVDVRADGRPEPVLEWDGRPVLWLPAGEHRLSGRFAWPGLPERLPVPSTTGLISLTVDDQPVPFPRRDEAGELWLSAGESAADEDERLGLVVARRIEDAVPLRIITRIRLRVSGRAREVSLGRVLLADSAPVSIESELPARLEPDGQLRLQVRAGTHQLEIHARSEGSPARLSFPADGPGKDWPDSEVWVFAADEALRQVELSGAPAVDPARTELDPDWRGLPTFMLSAGQALSFATQRRGEPTPPPNHIELSRQLWLDLDGAGYTVRDDLSAQLKQGFRLDLLAGQLGHVQSGGEDLLITRSPDSEHAGVELRDAQAQVRAEWRAEQGLSDLPAVGWSEDVQQLSMQLHLGPGYELLSVHGVDDVPSGNSPWIDRWDLIDLFFVLLIAIALGKLFGLPVGLLALVTLVLCQHARHAPDGQWLFVLVTLSLLRVLPTGRLRTGMRFLHAFALLLLALAAVPFVVDQLKCALFPQLGARNAMEYEGAGFGHLAFQAPTPEFARSAEAPMSPPKASGGAMIEEEAVEADMVEDEPAPMRSRKVAVSKQGNVWLGSLAGRSGTNLGQDPEAVVQTGPGVPSWQWQSYQLQWTGPVARDHHIGLVLLSPLQSRLVGVLRVLLLAGLLLLILRASRAALGPPKADPPPPASDATGAGAVAGSASLLGLCAWIAGTLLCGTAGTARADIPSGEVIEQLRARLTEPHACRPRCATIASMAIGVDARGLRIEAEVHVQERTAVPLPGPAETWVPESVKVDGRAEAPVALRPDGFLHVRLDPGVHRVELTGPLPALESLTLALPERPQRASARADGFRVDGIRPDGTLEGAIQLSRLQSAQADAPLASAALPPWLELTRELTLGITWTVQSQLRRVGPAGQPLVVRVPLLPGESITASELQVSDGAVSVPFERAAEEMTWSSTLEPGDALALSAAAGRPYSERWRIACGPVWHCRFDGIAPIHHVIDGRFSPEYLPWPGERVTVRVDRPAPAPGQSVTIDSATLKLSPGVRMLDANLSLSVRSSRGGVQQVTLPEAAVVQSLTVDGAARPIRREGQALAVSLRPGPQRLVVSWQEPLAEGLRQTMPAVSLGRSAVNVEQTIELPRDRWLLWVDGPAWGPAILFWPYLVFVVLLGLLLGRAPHSPLSSLQWVLLGLGLTRVPAAAAIVVVGFFLALSLRGKSRGLRPWLFDLRQLALLGFSVAALGCLYAAVHEGLLAYPDMDVAGPGSTAGRLFFYSDRVADALPTPSYVSAPVWVYRALMLAWALWLAASLVKWSRWAFQQYGVGGYWLRLRKPNVTERPAPPAP